MSSLVNTTKPKFVEVRSFLWSNVDKILEGLNANKNLQKIETDDLFASLEDSNTNKPTANFHKDYELRSELEILQQEKESLGIYVSGNPLANYQKILTWSRNTAFLDNLYLILVEKVRKIFTKKGTMMLAITLSSFEFEAEGIVFSKQALAMSSVLEEKQIYWVWGELKQAEKKEDQDLEEETKQYDEADKLIIKSVSPIGEGILKILQEQKIEISEARLKLLEKVDFKELATNPQNLEKILQKSSQNDQTKKVKIDETEKVPITIKIAHTTSKDETLEIKNLLQTEKNIDLIEVILEVQTASGWRRAKNSFWVNQENLNKIQKILLN